MGLIAYPELTMFALRSTISVVILSLAALFGWSRGDLPSVVDFASDGEYVPVPVIPVFRTGSQGENQGHREHAGDPSSAGPCVCCSQPPVAHASHTGDRVQEGCPGQTATAGTLVSDSRACTTWSQKGSTLLLSKRPLASFGTDGSNDPSDDGTTRDPTDDDQTSKDLDGDGETNVPIIALLTELVPYLVAPECAPATWTEVPSSPFLLPLPRLRC